MTNPTDLLDAIVDSLADIPELVTLLGGGSPANIVAYKHQWPEASSWMLALHDLKPKPSIMALYRGRHTGRGANGDSRAHDFSLLLRDGAGVDIHAIQVAITDGVPTSGGGLKWMYAVHEDVDMIREPDFALRTMQVAEGTFLDYWEAQFTLTEKFAG